jgi:uncharacterized membrane protein
MKKEWLIFAAVMFTLATILIVVMLTRKKECSCHSREVVDAPAPPLSTVNNEEEILNTDS